MIQEYNAAALQSSLQAYGKSSNSGAGSVDRAQETSQQPADQATQASPDVIASFSEAGLEAARSLTQSTEVGAQDRSEERAGESEFLESSVKQQQEVAQQSEQQEPGRIDYLA